MDSWTVINAVIILTAPFVLLWGWMKYFPNPQRSDWRSRASVLGLSAPLLSLAVWLFTVVLAHWNQWNTSTPAVRGLTRVGVWVPILGLVAGLAGRPRLIMAIIPTCIAAVLFWYGTTLP